MRRAVGLLAGAVALATAAGALASLALFALAVGLLVVMVGAGVSVAVAVHCLTVTRWVLAREVREDQPIGVRFEVRGRGRLPVPVYLEAQVDADGWVPLGERAGTLQLTVGRRGAWQLGPSRLRLRDGLGVFAWSVVAGQPEPLLVLPTPDLRVPVPPRSGAWAPDPDPDPDPDGLQPYVPGTPIGRVYWPALARGAGLQQRRLAPPPSGLPLVVVDTAGASDPRVVDWAARVAAGVILRLVGSGGCRVLLPGDHTATTVTDTAATWRGMHRRLALMTPADPAVPRVPPGDGQAPVVWIRAADAPAEVLSAPPQPLPPGVVAPPTERGRARDPPGRCGCVGAPPGGCCRGDGDGAAHGRWGGRVVVAAGRVGGPGRAAGGRGGPAGRGAAVWPPGRWPTGRVGAGRDAGLRRVTRPAAAASLAIAAGTPDRRRPAAHCAGKRQRADRRRPVAAGRLATARRGHVGRRGGPGGVRAVGPPTGDRPRGPCGAVARRGGGAPARPGRLAGHRCAGGGTAVVRGSTRGRAAGAGAGPGRRVGVGGHRAGGRPANPMVHPGVPVPVWRRGAVSNPADRTHLRAAAGPAQRRHHAGGHRRRAGPLAHAGPRRLRRGRLGRSARGRPGAAPAGGAGCRGDGGGARTAQRPGGRARPDRRHPARRQGEPGPG